MTHSLKKSAALTPPSLSEAAQWTEWVRSASTCQFIFHPRPAVAEVAGRVQANSSLLAFAAHLESRITRWNATGCMVREGADHAAKYIRR